MKNLKILGLLLLALVGVMAVSASAAQAKWLLLRNGVSVLELKLTANLPLGKLLVAEPGLEIHCDSGTASATAKLNATHTVLSGEATATFTSCEDKIWSEVCAVGSVGQANETIVAKGTGAGGMGAGEEEYFIEAKASPEFTNVEYRGAECPLTEIDGRVAGSVKLDVLNALADTTTKTARVLDNLTFGGNPAELHDGAATPKDVKITASEVSGNSFGVHLVGL